MRKLDFLFAVLVAVLAACQPAQQQPAQQAATADNVPIQPKLPAGIKNAQLDKEVKPLNLTAQEKADLLAFLKSLNGEGWQAKPAITLPAETKTGS
jgi:hypothetical protein